MKNLIIPLVILFLVSCKQYKTEVTKDDGVYAIDSTMVTPQLKTILIEYIKEYPQFKNIMLDNEFQFFRGNLDNKNKDYYYLRPTYLGEHVGNEPRKPYPAICIKFYGRNVFVQSSCNKILDQHYAGKRYLKHQEFEGIKNNLDKYYWLIRIDNNNQACVISKNIEPYNIPISPDTQYFKAPVNK